MAEFLIQYWRLVQLIEFAIHLNPLEPLLAQLQHLLLILALTIPHDGRQKVAPRAFLQGHDPVNHILYLLSLNRQAGCRAVGRACTGKEQPQVIVDLGHSAHSGARVFRRGLLLNRDRRAETGNVIYIRLFHHIEELARIGA